MLHLLNVDARQTEDIDLAGPLTTTQAETLKLMALAEHFSLPVEAINQAGAFFLYRIPMWEQKLILVLKGITGAVYRPNLELFFQLKLARLTEADVEDCINYLNYSILHRESFDAEAIVKICRGFAKIPSKSHHVNRLILELSNSLRS